MSETPTTSVYVPCYNAERTLSDVLSAILTQSNRPNEVFVVNDGSTDGTADIAARFASQGVAVVSQPHNMGLAAARNRALATATGEMLIGLDADVLPAPDFIANALTCLAAHPKADALCGRLTERHTDDVANRWRATHMSLDLGPEPYENPRFLFCGVTCMRREAAKRVGGWDDRFRASYDDVDFTERLRAHGIRFRYEASCCAQHLKRDTPQSVLRGFWGWFKPAGVLRGHFDSFDAWVRLRIEAVQWGIFRYRFARDLDGSRDELLALTLLLPWVMTVYDLCELQGRSDLDARRSARAAQALPDVARRVLASKGAPTEVVEWAGTEISKHVAKAQWHDEGGDESVTEAIEEFRDVAARSLPHDVRTWRRVLTGCKAIIMDEARTGCAVGATE